MPAKQPFRSDRLIEVPRRIEHHFDNAFDTAVHDVDAGRVHAQTARDRGTDLRRVELLPFDFAALITPRSLQARVDDSRSRARAARRQPRRASSMVATSILFIDIIASKARLASAPPAASASVSVRGVICQERPQRSLHQPHALSWPPLPTIAFQ